MISFFRSIFQSKIGLAFTFAFLALIVVAFATADIGGSNTFGGVTQSGVVAKVGDREITSADLNLAVNSAYRAAQRERPNLDLKSFVELGGLESTLERMINGEAVAAYGIKYGFAAGKRLVDSEISRIEAFQGADGKFSEENFRRTLQQQGVSEKDIREDFVRNLFADQLLINSRMGITMPDGLITPYASLILEKRKGVIATIPSVAFLTPAKPENAAISAFYSKNSDRYTVPERRSISYAIIDRSRFDGKISPSDKDIQGYYNKNKQQYSASELRKITQVIVPTEAAAKALAETIAGGQSMKQAAEAVGLSQADLGELSKTELASSASQAVADAAFSAQSGQIAEPAQSGLGWHIVKVQGVQSIKAKSLADARQEITDVLTKEQTDEALANLTVGIEDEFAEGSSLADIALSEKLELQTTGKLLASGQDPENANFKPGPELAPVITGAFSVDADDDPQVVEILPGEKYAVFDIVDVEEAAPPPLKKIENLVTRDYLLDQGARSAKKLADKLADSVDENNSLKSALSKEKKRLPPAQTVNLTRQDLVQQGERTPPPLALLFSMAEGTAKVLEAPNRQGWFIVHLEKLTPGDASKREDLMDASRAQFKQVFAREYEQQLISAMIKDVGVTRNETAIEAVKNQLLGKSTSGL